MPLPRYTSWSCQVNGDVPSGNRPVGHTAATTHTLGCPVTHAWHRPHDGIGVITTLSPGATLVTPSPTDSTSPAASCPSTTGNGVPKPPLIDVRSE